MQPIKRRTANVPYIFFMVAGALLVLAALIYLGSAVAAQGDSFDYLGIVPCPALIFLVGLVVFDIGLRDRQALARVSRPEVSLSNQNPRVGETVTLSYRQSFRARTDVKGIEFQLIRREAETHSAGKSSITLTHDLVLQEHKLPGRSFEAGESLSEQYQFQPRGMHTFHGVWHRVDWLIRARVELAGSPAYTEEYALQVASATAE